MPNLRLIRGRIRSIRNTAKVTKAMEMVAASKMRRSQTNALATRPYAEKLNEVLGDLAARYQGSDERIPLLEERPVKRIAVVHMAADRGLCGGFNANVNRRTATFLVEDGHPAWIVAVGRRGRDFMARAGQTIRAEFTSLGDYPKLLDVAPIARVAMDDYVKGEVDRVYLVYTQFVNTLVQRPVLQQLLPVQPPPDYGHVLEYIYEPNPIVVLQQLLPRYLEMEVYHAVLESLASEHSARMVAMRNATENAKEVIEALTLAYNKARQEAITKELLEIAGAAAAL